MKTLNRTLSLALVFALVFSLMSFAFAATTTTTTTTLTTTYTDEASINYQEAVGVTSAIGVFQGNNGAFDPKGNLTREQAAKIITYLLVGKENADKLTAGVAPYTDVPADRWSAGSIAYCKNAGIIAGYGNGNFGPNDQVTGYQFSKMLLVALGYDATIEGFNGNDWAVNVAKRAFENKLYTNNEQFNGNAAATREEAALYTFNILNAYPVTYQSKGTTITTNGVSIVTGATPAAHSTNTYGVTYYPTLVGTSTTDKLGNPAKQYTYKGLDAGTYAKKAAYTYTASKASAAGVAELTKTFNGFDFTTLLKTAVFENGKVEGASGASAINSAATLAAKTGNGVVVNVYVNADNVKQITAVTVSSTELVKVSAINSTTGDVTLTSVSTPKLAGTYTVTTNDDVYASVKGQAVGTYLLATPNTADNGATYTVAKIATPTTVAGYITVVGADPNDGIRTMTVGGKSYYAAKVCTAAVGTAAVSATTNATITLDTYGYIVNVKSDSVATKNFVYVLKTYSTLKDGQIVKMIKGVLTDGTIVDTAAKWDADGTIGTTNDLGDAVDYTDPGTVSAGNLYAVETIKSNVYYLCTAPTAATMSSANIIAAANTVATLNAGNAVKTSDKTVASASISGANYYNNYYSGSVKFIYVSTSSVTANVKSGVQEVTALPAGAIAVVEPNSTTDSTPVVTAVIIPGAATTAAVDSLLFFPGQGTVSPIGTVVLKNSSTNENETYNVYAAYKNGELTKVPTNDTPAANSYYTYGTVDNVAGAVALSSAAYNVQTGSIAVTKAESDAGNILGSMGVAVNPFNDSVITVVPAHSTDGVTITPNTSDAKLIDISGATFYDLRLTATKAAKPVTLSAEGICAAAAKGLAISVIYNADTNKAAVVYVLQRNDGFTLTYTNTNFKVYTDKACTAANEVTSTTKIDGGTTLYVESTSTADATNGLTSGTVTLTKVTLPVDDTSAAVYSFTMPYSAITLTCTQADGDA